MKNSQSMKDALWSDCETDTERINFLQSGRAVETGIIAPAIIHDVIMAFQFRKEIIKERKNETI